MTFLPTQITRDVAQALTKNYGKQPDNSDTNLGPNLVSNAVGVRRLTPRECERLQGLPDDWTKLDDKTPDSRRYSALGDAVTANVGEWIGRRLADA